MEENVRGLRGPEVSPRDVGEAREAVEASRQRVAETLQELEGRLVEEKESLQERLDVARPARDYITAKPLVAVGLAVGAGLLFGLLTGNSRRAEPEPDLTDRESDVVRRWRRERRKRLMDTAADELPSFEPPPSRLGRLFRDMTHEMVGAATALLVAGVVNRVQEEEVE